VFRTTLNVLRRREVLLESFSPAERRERSAGERPRVRVSELSQGPAGRAGRVAGPGDHGRRRAEQESLLAAAAKSPEQAAACPRGDKNHRQIAGRLDRDSQRTTTCWNAARPSPPRRLCFHRHMPSQPVCIVVVEVRRIRGVSPRYRTWSTSGVWASGRVCFRHAGHVACRNDR